MARDRAFAQAGAHIQDAWHYFDTILGGDTFGWEGRSLKGRVELYESGRERLIEALDAGHGELDDPGTVADEINDLLYVDDIEDERQLKDGARRGRTLTERLARAWGVDPVTGVAPEHY
jgi:hypothetical protein